MEHILLNYTRSTHSFIHPFLFFSFLSLPSFPSFVLDRVLHFSEMGPDLKWNSDTLKVMWTWTGYLDLLSISFLLYEMS